jgi:hypothetical protein
MVIRDNCKLYIILYERRYPDRKHWLLASLDQQNQGNTEMLRE